MTARRFITLFDRLALPLFNAAVLSGVSLVALSLVAQG
jgi:hypothetical protein